MNDIPNIPDLSGLPSSTPNPLAQGALDPQGQPPPANNHRSRLKMLLSDVLSGMADAGAAHVGLETSSQKEARLFREDLQTKQFQSLDAQRESLEEIKRTVAQQQLAQNTPFELPDDIASTLGLPSGIKMTQKDFGSMLGKYIQAKTSNTGKVDAATITANAGITKAGIAAGSKTPNEIGLILKANQGDPEAAAALKTLQGNRIATSAARGAAFGQYRIQNVYDPESGQTTPMFMHDIQQQKSEGKTLLSAGAMPAGVLLSSQRLKSEAEPAIREVNQYLDVYDDPTTRATFARVMKDNPMPEGGDVHSWIGNILDQSLKGGLSPRAQLLIPRLKRLNETVGTLRATLGLPATNSATALTLSLLPGASTPNAKFARDQMDQLSQVVTQALNVPGLGNKPKSSAGGAAPEGTRIKVGNQIQVKRGGRWIPE